MSDNGPEHGKRILLGMNNAELVEVAKSLGMPSFAGEQMARWMYEKHVGSINEMTNLSKNNRERLNQDYCIGAMPPVDCQRSADGTVKYLFPVNTTAGCDERQLFVETVYIPDNDRATLCVSCQVGCRMNCLFCQTGKQGFEGHLTVADILNQIYSLPEREQLTNVVFMGQGEPMDNLDNVLRATQILTDDKCYAWSPKRITVSSVGIVNKLRRFLDESLCHVAISMHSPLHDQRAELMPVERSQRLSDVIGLLRQYDFTHQRRCSFEYICFAGMNDTIAHGQAIVKLLQGIECRVNLIRFHTIPGISLPETNEQRMEQLRDYLTAHGVFTTIRASRGQDIFAACGLLSTDRKDKERNNP